MRPFFSFFSLLLVGMACLVAVPALAQGTEETAPPPEQAAPQEQDRPGLWRRVWPRPDAGAPAEAPSAPVETRIPAPTRRLAAVHGRLRDSRVGADPTGRRFLDLMEREEPTAAQLNEFGIWLSGQGLLEAAQEHFRAALQVERGSADIWNHLGMVQMRLGDSSAKSSFQRAIALDPAHAMAHYNLGTLLDAEGAYDAAIETFMRALTLDPRLGDPAHNPQAVHNPRLLVVRLELYERKARTLGLPMTSMPGGKPGPGSDAGEK